MSNTVTVKHCQVHQNVKKNWYSSKLRQNPREKVGSYCQKTLQIWGSEWGACHDKTSLEGSWMEWSPS